MTAVVDGDTIRVRPFSYRTYTVRLIGIDTPETKRPGTTVECGGPNATSSMFGSASPTRATQTATGSTTARAARAAASGSRPTHQDRRDRYGRLLAYVKSAQGSLAGKQLRAGWAAVYVFEAPFEQFAAFQAAEAAARDASRGVWGKCAGNFHTPAVR